MKTMAGLFSAVDFKKTSGSVPEAPTYALFGIGAIGFLITPHEGRGLHKQFSILSKNTHLSFGMGIFEHHPASPSLGFFRGLLLSEEFQAAWRGSWTG
jgi:hypothetical protein